MNYILGKRFTEITATHVFQGRLGSEARQVILKDIIPNTTHADIPCLCSSAEKKDFTLATIDKWGLPARNVICATCGLIRISPRWDEGTYSNIYANYYWPMHLEQTELTQSRFNLSVKRAASYAEYLKSKLDLKGKDVLEIGCSYGAGLFQLKDSGANLTGYDYDERFLDAGRTFTGIDLKSGGVKEAIVAGKTFDVVILRHVVEHFLDPVAELKLIKKLLNKDGALFVEVPGGLASVYNDDILCGFDVFHAYMYVLQTLKNMMGMCGFILVDGDERILSIWKQSDEPVAVEWSSPETFRKVISHLKDTEVKWQNNRSFKTRVIRKMKSVLQRFVPQQ